MCPKGSNFQRWLLLSWQVNFANESLGHDGTYVFSQHLKFNCIIRDQSNSKLCNEWLIRQEAQWISNNFIGKPSSNKMSWFRTHLNIKCGLKSSGCTKSKGERAHEKPDFLITAAQEDNEWLQFTVVCPHRTESTVGLGLELK